MFETAFPGTQTFLPLFTNAAAQPLSRFHQHSAIYNEACRARIQSTFSGVCLVFIWCLLLFGETVSYSDLSPENGLNTDVIAKHSQRQTPVNPFGRHSKTACRGFKSFCPCHSFLASESDFRSLFSFNSTKNYTTFMRCSNLWRCRERLSSSPLQSFDG